MVVDYDMMILDWVIYIEIEKMDNVMILGVVRVEHVDNIEERDIDTEIKKVNLEVLEVKNEEKVDIDEV